MNRLNLDLRVRILSALVEGNSVRGTARIVGVDKKTVLRLLADVGDACDRFLDENVRDLKSERVQCDELWSFCHAKDRNLKPELRGVAGIGDLWTWTAIDADTKLMVTWHLGKRSSDDANAFIRDLADRIVTRRVQITTDGFGAYRSADPTLVPYARRLRPGGQGLRLARRDGEPPSANIARWSLRLVTRTPLLGPAPTRTISRPPTPSGATSQCE